ncbi:uncharacterized protein RSE6_06229 [Rhynchosporium secalis]|uniref:Spore coat protein SP96 n=1 Tax=Rhynchosporium secalis TaxID=38038 RepID=A0A1E1M9U5_RHYSE|nr:uncharacterized protein RSE6_06229 [Rhynchosporium secalis]
MISTTFVTALVALVATVSQAHMEMKWPPALSGRYNQFTVTKDSNNHAPLSPDGSTFPCRSHLSDLGTPAGASVVTWNAGAEYNFTITGIIDEPLHPAFHNGGSCQAALSYDSGKTWKVIHSYQGACPTSTGGDFKFNIPSDAATGAAVFAWLWWNHTGNREMYMNCASITIGPGFGPAPEVAFAQRPDIFKANIGNGCTTTQETDVFFPNPGSDVTTVGAKQEKTFSGECGPASPPASGQNPAPPTVPAQAPAAGIKDPSVTKSVMVIGVLPSSPPVYTPPAAPASSAMTISTTGDGDIAVKHPITVLLILDACQALADAMESVVDRLRFGVVNGWSEEFWEVRSITTKK